MNEPVSKLSKIDAIKGRIEAAKATRKGNTQRRKGMSKKSISLKVCGNKLYKHQKVMLEKFFLEAKWLTNAVIGSNDIFNFVLTPTVPVMLYNEVTGKCDIPEMRELTLGSQMQQGLVTQVQTDIINLAKKKAKGGVVGARRFSKEQNCIPLPQCGVTYWQLANKNYFKIQKIGKVRVSGVDQIKDNYEMAEAKLIRKPSGYYLHILCYVPKEAEIIVKGSSTGVDFGCKTAMTDIQGNETKIYVDLPKQLKKVQQASSRKYAANKKCRIKGQKWSKNYSKTSRKLRKIYENVTNKKKDLVRKAINKYKAYEVIALQDDSIKGWQSGRYGRTISRSAVGQLKKELKKLDSDGRKVIVIDRYLPTTQECPDCLVKTKLELSQRTFTCSKCGFEEPRDRKGARCIYCYGMYELETGIKPRRAGRTPLSVEQLASVYSYYSFENSDINKSIAMKQETARLA